MPKAYIQLGASGSSPSICPARATGCVVLNVPRRTETAQENGISADFCFAACKIFSCEYIHIIPYLFTDVLWEYC